MDNYLSFVLKGLVFNVPGAPEEMKVEIAELTINISIKAEEKAVLAYVGMVSDLIMKIK